MTREILFRGKIKDGGEWVYGIPINTHIGTFISWEENPHYCSQYNYMEISEIGLVDSETLGQYTGLADKNGNRIFEGDILQCNNNPLDLVKAVFGAFTVIDMETESTVDGVFGWHYEVIPTADPLSKVEPFCYSMPLTDYYIDRCGMVIVGNVHDNPELMEVTNHESDKK